MIYAALIIFGLAVPFAVGAWAGACFGVSACFLVCVTLVGLLLGGPMLLLEVLPRGSLPWLEDLLSSVLLVALLGGGVMVGEFTAGMMFGRKGRSQSSLGQGIGE